MATENGNPRNIKVGDDVTFGEGGQVVYGVAKIVGDTALCIKVFGTRAKIRKIQHLSLSNLFPA